MTGYQILNSDGDPETVHFECPFCKKDKTGNHEYSCPNHPIVKNYGEALNETN